MTHSLQNVVLADPHSNAVAEILVGFGFNCHRLRLDCDTQSVEVLRSSPDFSTHAGNPTGSGLPVMFPFPGRILGTELRWKNKTYPLPAGDGQGNAIHGFVLDRPWRVISQEPQRIVAEFEAGRDAPELLRQWPSDFRISADYELAKNRFQMVYRVSNPSRSLVAWESIRTFTYPWARWGTPKTARYDFRGRVLGNWNNSSRPAVNTACQTPRNS